MTDYGPRISAKQITLGNRTWNDARHDIEPALNALVQLADVVNIIIDESRISEGGGTTTVELPGQGGGHAYFHSGA